MSTASFVLPLKGMAQGTYRYDLTVDEDFLATYSEQLAFRRADIDLVLSVEKESREMVIEFALDGTVGTDCDRCLADIDLPITDRRRLIVKFTQEEEPIKDEGEIVYLQADTNEFNLGPFIYEMVVLAVPMIRTFGCREGQPPYPCDEDVLERIDASTGSVMGEGEQRTTEEQSDRPSPWDVLKGLNNN